METGSLPAGAGAPPMCCRHVGHHGGPQRPARGTFSSPGVGGGVRGPFCPSSAPDPGGRISRVTTQPEVAPRWPERGTQVRGGGTVDGEAQPCS